MKILITLLILPCALFCAPLSFLYDGAGARAASLGGSSTAAPSPADSPYWNPAGMLAGSSCRNCATGAYTKLDLDRASGYFAACERASDDSSALGIFWLNRYSGGVEGRDALGNPGSLLLMSSNAAGLAAALKLPGVKAGASLKYYFVSLAGSSARGFGADLALEASPFGKEMELGLSVRDISPGLYWDTGLVEKLPFCSRFGACLKAIPERLSFSSEIKYLEGVYLSAGAEYLIGEAIAVRGGLSKDGPAFGVGFLWQDMALDYSFLPDNNTFGAKHIFSVTFAY